LHKATRGEPIRAGKNFEALPLARAAMASLEKTSPGSRHFAGALNNLAQLYGDLGRDAEAEPLQKRALAIMEKAVGLDSQDISQAIPQDIPKTSPRDEQSGRAVPAAGPV
jgi:Tetratricopeptide repeat